MSNSYKGLTRPSDSDTADGPGAFTDLIDSGPVPRFSTTTARDTAIPSPVTGLLCFVGTTLQQYVSGAWSAVIPPRVQMVTGYDPHGSAYNTPTGPTFGTIASASFSPPAGIVQVSAFVQWLQHQAQFKFVVNGVDSIVSVEQMHPTVDGYHRFSIAQPIVHSGGSLTVSFQATGLTGEVVAIEPGGRIDLVYLGPT